MKTIPSLALATLACLSPCLGTAAEPGKKSAYPDRTELAQRSFGNVRFIMGAGSAQPWLEMYSDGRMIAAFQGFSADEVVAAPDGEHFLALSNSLNSTMAYALLDRDGRIVDSGPHGDDLHYCRRTNWGINEWVDAQSPDASFLTEKSETAADHGFVAVTVRGCDGKTVRLGRSAPMAGPSRTAQAPGTGRPPSLEDCSRPAPEGTVGGSFFIGCTIAHLREMDPSFGARTLTLSDGRPPDIVPPALESTQPR
jgi:hypothetical protein